MNIEIRKLSPALLNDYLRFFDTDAQADNPNPDDRGCYCVCWCGIDHRMEPDFSTPQKRRELAKKYINSGALQGYLAYDNGRVVGWCNANTQAECLHCVSWLRFMAHVQTEDPSAGIRVKCVYCFAIAPDMKRNGIAALLLDRVTKDAADEGFDYVEAYPNKSFINEFRDFMGPMALYKQAGFSVFAEYEDVFVMRKPLKTKDVYETAPVMKTSRFILRLVREEDAEDLLTCYADPKSQSLFNADNCTSDFRYSGVGEMLSCIRVWLDSYRARGFVRWSVIDKQTECAVGTVEMFSVPGFLPEGAGGVLRIDLASAYETDGYLAELLGLANERFYSLFGAELFVVKAKPEATARVNALLAAGYSPYDWPAPGREHYYIRKRPLHKGAFST